MVDKESQAGGLATLRCALEPQELGFLCVDGQRGGGGTAWTKASRWGGLGVLG